MREQGRQPTVTANRKNSLCHSNAVERLGQKLKAGELKDIVAIPTSIRTKEQAEGLGIPLVTLDTHSGESFVRPCTAHMGHALTHTFMCAHDAPLSTPYLPPARALARLLPCLPAWAGLSALLSFPHTPTNYLRFTQCWTWPSTAPTRWTRS